METVAIRTWACPSPMVFAAAAVTILLPTTAAQADPFVVSATLDHLNLANNWLCVTPGAGGASRTLAFEGSGATLGDRFELRLTPDVELTDLSLPDGWTHQEAVLEEAGERVQLATIFYQGLCPLDDAEFFDLGAGFAMRFTLKEKEGSGGTVESGSVPVTLDGFATALVPGIGAIPVSQRDSFAARVSDRPSPTPFPVDLRDVGLRGATLRFNLPPPGVRYRIERTNNLADWSTASVGAPVIDGNRLEIQVSGFGERRAFFRVVLEAELEPAP